MFLSVCMVVININGNGCEKATKAKSTGNGNLSILRRVIVIKKNKMESKMNQEVSQLIQILKILERSLCCYTLRILRFVFKLRTCGQRVNSMRVWWMYALLVDCPNLGNVLALVRFLRVEMIMFFLSWHFI